LSKVHQRGSTTKTL